MGEATAQFSAQATRVLEHTRTLEDCYGMAMQQADPVSAKALREAVEALERLLDESRHDARSLAG